MKMKLACAVAAAVLLAGCSSSKDEGSKPSASPAVGSETVELDSLEHDLLTDAIDTTPSLTGKSDSDVLAIFGSVCASLASPRGDGNLIALRNLLDQGFPAEDAGGILIYAAAVSCQDQISKARLGN